MRPIGSALRAVAMIAFGVLEDDAERRNTIPAIVIGHDRSNT